MADRRILYISGEESERQIKLRADRIALAEDTGHCLLLCDTELNNVFTHVADVAPDLVIIDSIQTMSLSEVDSAPGSVTQIRACASALLQFAKQSGIPVIIIGHITKEGTLAAPRYWNTSSTPSCNLRATGTISTASCAASRTVSAPRPNWASTK